MAADTGALAYTIRKDGKIYEQSDIPNCGRSAQALRIGHIGGGCGAGTARRMGVV